MPVVLRSIALAYSYRMIKENLIVHLHFDAINSSFIFHLLHPSDLTHPVPRLIIAVTFTGSKGDDDSALQTSLLLATVIHHMCVMSTCMDFSRERKDAVGVQPDPEGVFLQDVCTWLLSRWNRKDSPQVKSRKSKVDNQ